MAEKPDSNADDSAEKAYAAAAEAVTSKSDSEAPAEDVPVAFPPKARRNSKAAAQAKDAAPEPQDVAQQEAAAPVPSAPKPAKQSPATARKVAVRKPAAKKAVAKKPAVQKVAVKKAQPAVAKPATVKPATTKPGPAAAEPVQKTSIFPKNPTIAQLKDKIMATTKTPDFTAGIQDVIVDVQAKAKEAFEKGSSAFGDANEFAKGNVEALVESGKILAAGLQDMGTSLAAEGRSAFETMTADVKELSSTKSPADFFKLQGEIARRNFDTVVASGSKHSEALMKLASDVFVPLSGRVSVAVDKARKSA